MQSLAAYTPELAELNAAFLRSARAPANIVFQIATVDDHFPSLEDGRSWPELLTRYEVQEVEWLFVRLKRSAAPRAWRLEPLAEAAMRFGELVPVPPATNGPVWASFEMDQTVIGKIAATLYKPPILWLTVFTQDGGRLRYRLVPGMARSGFVLSPVIRNCAAFAALAGGGALRDLAGKQATFVSLSADTGSGSTGCYRAPVRLRLYRLEYPGQDLSRVASFRELRSLSRMLARGVLLGADARPEFFYSARCGSVLRVAARCAIQFSLEGRPRRLRLGFGVEAGEAASAQGSQRVVFRVSAVGEGGRRVELWSRALEPPAEAGGLEEQRAVVDLSEVKSSDLILETVPAGPEQRGGVRCYWRQIEAEEE